jgi:hypothetical protein
MMHPILLRLTSYWRVNHVKDEILNVNGGRLNIDLLHRVLRAKRVAEYRAVTAAMAKSEAV